MTLRTRLAWFSPSARRKRKIRRFFPAPTQPIMLDVRGPGEWIVSSPLGGKPLHVQRLPDGDWLVAETGSNNEGRAAQLQQAIATLSAKCAPADWWSVIAAALGERHTP